MPDEEIPLRTIPAERQRLSATDPRDDWLSDASELDWFPGDDEGETGESVRSGGRGRGPRRQASAGPLGERSLQQRRLIAVGVLLALVVAAVLVVVLTSGGNKASTPPPVTTPVTTTPATGTKTSTGTSGTTTKKHTTTSASTVTLPKSGSLKSGDTGAQVTALQHALTTLGATGLKADGNFGSKTQDAVTAFQTQHKLTADGVVGSKTAQAINTALAQLAG